MNRRAFGWAVAGLASATIAAEEDPGEVVAAQDLLWGSRRYQVRFYPTGAAVPLPEGAIACGAESGPGEFRLIPVGIDVDGGGL